MKKTRDKIIYNIQKSRIVNDSEIFKKLNANVWEFRTLYKKIYYRFFAFWDKTDKTETVVVSTHGIKKKTLKIPQKEITKTERIMKQHFDAKK